MPDHPTALNRRALTGLLLEAGLIIAFSLQFIFFRSVQQLSDYNTALPAWIVIGAAGLAWLIVGRRAATPIGWALLLWLAAYTLSGITTGETRRMLGGLPLALLIIFFFALAADLSARGYGRRVLTALLTGGVVVMLFLWVKVGAWYEAWLAAEPGQWIPRLVSRLPMENTMAFFLAALLLTAFARLFEPRRVLERATLALYVFSAGALLFLSSSRAAWLGTAAGGVMIVALAYRQNSAAWKAAWRRVTARRWLLAVIIVVGLAVLAAGGYILYRQTLHPTHSQNFVDSRMAFWTAAWNAFLQRPLTGWGPWTYPTLYAQAASVPPAWHAVHAHNVALTALAEMGLAGLAALLGLWLAAVRGLMRRLRGATPAQWGLAAAAAGALAAFTVIGLFDGLHHEPMGLMAFAVIIGCGLANPPLETSRPARPWGVLALVAVGALNLAQLEPLARGQLAANSGDWTTAAAVLQAEAERDSRSAAAWQQAGLAQAELAWLGDTDALAAAVADFENAQRLDPGWGPFAANLAALYTAQGSDEQALAAWQTAVDDARDMPLFILNLAAASEAQGDLDTARALYSRAIARGAPCCGAAFWSGSPARQAAAADQLAKRAQKPAEQPDLAALRTRAAAFPPEMRTYLDLAEAALAAGETGEADHALALARLAYAEYAADDDDLRWLTAELAAARGDLAQATEQGELALSAWTQPNAPWLRTRSDFYLLHTLHQPGMLVEYVPQMTALPPADKTAARLDKLAGWYAELGRPADAERARAALAREFGE